MLIFLPASAMMMLFRAAQKNLPWSCRLISIIAALTLMSTIGGIFINNLFVMMIAGVAGGVLSIAAREPAPLNKGTVK